MLPTTYIKNADQREFFERFDQVQSWTEIVFKILLTE